MNNISIAIKQGLLLIFLLLILTGIIYPITVTALAQLFFHKEANGSLIVINEEVIGSSLIGQYFNSEKYFWGRPSATPRYPYNSENSAASNLSPTNATLLKNISDQIAHLQNTDTQNKKLIPVDLVTASASGLDPDISLEAAMYQISRIAKARKIPEKTLVKLIESLATPRSFYLLGEPRINVLKLNLALDDEEKWRKNARTTT